MCLSSVLPKATLSKQAAPRKLLVLMGYTWQINLFFTPVALLQFPPLLIPLFFLLLLCCQSSVRWEGSIPRCHSLLSPEAQFDKTVILSPDDGFLCDPVCTSVDLHLCMWVFLTLCSQIVLLINKLCLIYIFQTLSGQKMSDNIQENWYIIL